MRLKAGTVAEAFQSHEKLMCRILSQKPDFEESHFTTRVFREISPLSIHVQWEHPALVTFTDWLLET